MNSKRNIRIVALFIITLFLVQPLIVVASDNDKMVDIASELDALFIAEFGYAFVQNHNQSVEIALSLEGSFARDRLGRTIYPEYFGGFYIDIYGNLVILVVKSAMIEAQGITNASISDIQFAETITREVGFSYNELIDMFRFLNKVPVYLASSWHVDVMKNRIVVNLVELNDESIFYFKQTIVDSPMIVFMESPESCFDLINYTNESNYLLNDINTHEMVIFNQGVINLMPGRALYYSPTMINFRRRAGSIGYRAFNMDNNGRVGFVTTAHGPPGHMLENQLRPGMPIYVVSRHYEPGSGFVRVGWVRRSRLVHNSIAHFYATPFRFDAAFIELDPEPGISINMLQLDYIIPLTRIPVVGEIVSTWGTPDAGFPGDGAIRLATSRVVAIHGHVHITGDNVAIDLVRTTPISGITGGGPSGGIVWFNSDRRTAGIHVLSDGSFCMAFAINDPWSGFNLILG